MTYELFCNSVRGASHIRKGTPCEDSGIKVEEDGIKIFAVADGHGDSNCLRSHIGSEYACRIASEELTSFARTIKEQGWEEKLFDKLEAKDLVERLITTIVGKWANAVSEELEQNPLTEDECKKAESKYIDEYTRGIRTERMYGTTLIVGLQTESYLLLLQQGDGRCDVFDCNGEVSQPIPWDDRCFSTVTTSLCDTDAAQSCRYHIINLKENPVIACVAGTDGVEDSFPSSMEKTHAYYRDLLRSACETGVEEFEKGLIDELNELSANGSADDITISGIIDVERVKGFLDVFAERNSLVDLEDQVAVLVSKVKSIEEGGKFEYLSNRYKKANSAYERAQTECRDLSAFCKQFAEMISAHEQGLAQAPTDEKKVVELLRKLILPQNELSVLKKHYEEKSKELEIAEANLRTAAKEKETAEKEYLPFKEKYDDLVQRRDDAIKRLNDLKG